MGDWIDNKWMRFFFLFPHRSLKLFFFCQVHSLIGSVSFLGRERNKRITPKGVVLFFINIILIEKELGFGGGSEDRAECWCGKRAHPFQIATITTTFYARNFHFLIGTRKTPAKQQQVSTRVKERPRSRSCYHKELKKKNIALTIRLPIAPHYYQTNIKI